MTPEKTRSIAFDPAPAGAGNLRISPLEKDLFILVMDPCARDGEMHFLQEHRTGERMNERASERTSGCARAYAAVTSRILE